LCVFGLKKLLCIGSCLNNRGPVVYADAVIYRACFRASLFVTSSVLALSIFTASSEAGGSILYGVTGDGASIGESLFTIDTGDATSSFLYSLGNGSDGETIAYNPNDNLIYHFSGRDTNSAFETVDPLTGTVVPIGYSGFTPDEPYAVAFDSATGGFLMVNLDQEFIGLTTAGAATVINPSTPYYAKGLVFRGNTLLATEQFDSFINDNDPQLLTLDPTTGAVLSSITINLAGTSLDGNTNGLAVDPMTGEVYAILRVGGTRILAILDPITGVATAIGNLSDKFAGITFNGIFAGLSQESLNLDEQVSLTSLFSIQHSYKILEGVGGNLFNQFNGGDTSNFISESGFSFQSSGIANKMAQSAISGFLEASEAKASINDRMMLKNSTKTGVYGADLEAAKNSDMAILAYNVWAKGSWSHYNGDGNSFDGSVRDVVGGIDYRVRDNLIVGGLVAYGKADFDTVTAGIAGGLDAKGYSLGGYVGWQINPALNFDAMIAWSDLEYENRSGAVTGSFDAQRWTFGAHLTGKMNYNDIVIMPMIGVMYSSEDQGSYVDSAAFFHASRDVDAGRISAGPKFVFPEMQTDSGTAQFWLATKAEYDFSNQNTAVTSGLPDFDGILSGRIQAGINVAAGEGAVFSLQGDVSGLGSNEYFGYGASVKLRISF